MSLDLQGWLDERREPFERALHAALPVEGVAPEPLRDAMAHLLFPGGKRLRPALAMAAAEAVGAAATAAHPVAVAVELVHTYSLIHDDLPCMDDDALRRGRPTVHVAYGESTAVLAGDALLALAFSVLADASDGEGDPASRLAALRELALAAGPGGLVGGQVDDLAGVAREVASVESVHRRKSAALIVAAVVGGAMLGGASRERVEGLRRFAFQLGVAFQIADDLLDADDEDGCSLVPVLGEKAARERAEALLGEALNELDALGELGEASSALRRLAEFAVRRSE